MAFTSSTPAMTGFGSSWNEPAGPTYRYTGEIPRSDHRCLGSSRSMPLCRGQGQPTMTHRECSQAGFGQPGCGFGHSLPNYFLNSNQLPQSATVISDNANSCIGLACSRQPDVFSSQTVHSSSSIKAQQTVVLDNMFVSRVFSNGISSHSAPILKEEIEPPTFSGSENWNNFIFRFEKIAAYNQWDSDMKRLRLTICLLGDALDFCCTLPSVGHMLYEDLKYVLQCRFSVPENAHVYRLKFRSRVRYEAEGVVSFLNDLQKLASKAFPFEIHSKLYYQLICDQFIQGINNNECSELLQLEMFKLNLSGPELLHKIFSLAQTFEVIRGTLDRPTLDRPHMYMSDYERSHCIPNRADQSRVRAVPSQRSHVHGYQDSTVFCRYNPHDERQLVDDNLVHRGSCLNVISSGQSFVNTGSLQDKQVAEPEIKCCYSDESTNVHENFVFKDRTTGAILESGVESQNAESVISQNQSSVCGVVNKVEICVDQSTVTGCSVGNVESCFIGELRDQCLQSSVANNVDVDNVCIDGSSGMCNGEVDNQSINSNGEDVGCINTQCRPRSASSDVYVSESCVKETLESVSSQGNVCSSNDNVFCHAKVEEVPIIVNVHTCRPIRSDKSVAVDSTWYHLTNKRVKFKWAHLTSKKVKFKSVLSRNIFTKS